METNPSKLIVVTGAAGFMGSHLVDFLLEQRHNVIGLDDLSGGYLRNVNPKSVFYKIDLRNSKKTVALIKELKPSLIFHLAADATEGRSQFTPLRSTQRNYLASLNVLLGAIKAETRRVVLTSSMSVYGDQNPPFSEDMPTKPVDIYGISKAAMEEATKVLSVVYGFEYTILRPHNVYGPRQNLADPYRNVVGIFINRMLMNKNFYIYGDGEQRRAFSFIDDVTQYIAKAGFLSTTNGEVINIGPSNDHSINELASEVLSHFTQDLSAIPEHLKPVFLPDRPQEVKNAFCTDEKARHLLGFDNETAFEAGVAKMVSWAKCIGPQRFKYLKNLEVANNHTPATWRNKLI